MQQGRWRREERKARVGVTKAETGILSVLCKRDGGVRGGGGGEGERAPQVIVCGKMHPRNQMRHFSIVLLLGRVGERD